MSPVNILVTGAGAPGIKGTVYALKNNPDEIGVKIVGTDIKENVVGRYLVENFYIVPKPEKDGYLEALLEICKEEDINFILPQTTREVQILAKEHKLFNASGIKIAVSKETAITLANNKYYLLETFARHNLPHPKYRLAKSESEFVESVYHLGYPSRSVVVRPPISNGMRGLRILTKDPWDVERYLNEKPSGVELDLDSMLKILRNGSYWPELLLTEYLPGPEYTVDVFRGREANVVIPRLRKSIRSGITFHSLIDIRKDIIEISLQAAKIMDLQYAFGFQYILDEAGVPKIIESNPRIQGTMVASIFAGYNIPWYTIRELMGDPVTINEVKNPAVSGIEFLRYWGGIAVLDGKVLGSI